MSMISELVKELRRAENPCGMVGVGYYRTLYARAADTIEELSAKLTINSQSPADVSDTNVGKWIPCSERLPEEDTYVLICSGEIVHEACFEDGHFSNDYGMWYKAIEYWMPLPEPYKGVE